MVPRSLRALSLDISKVLVLALVVAITKPANLPVLRPPRSILESSPNFIEELSSNTRATSSPCSVALSFSSSLPLMK